MHLYQTSMFYINSSKCYNEYYSVNLKTFSGSFYFQFTIEGQSAYLGKLF